MNTSTTAPPAGFFVQLMPLLADRTLMVIVSKADDEHLTLSVVPKRMKEGENAGLTTPLCCTGTPEELDRDLPTHLRDFVVGQVTLSNNLAQIQREREEAEKVAREELKKKQKNLGNSGSKAKTPDSKPRDEDRAVAPPAEPPMMSLFDSPGEAEIQSGTPSSSRDAEQNSNDKNNGGGE
jgi:PRTRC genetic system protein E